jgi:hypothetical protein
MRQQQWRIEVFNENFNFLEISDFQDKRRTLGGEVCVVSEMPGISEHAQKSQL